MARAHDPYLLHAHGSLRTLRHASTLLLECWGGMPAATPCLLEVYAPKNPSSPYQDSG